MYNNSISANLTEPAKAWLEAYAAERGLSISRAVNQLITERAKTEPLTQEIQNCKASQDKVTAFLSTVPSIAAASTKDGGQ
jgi:hypothetical protein